MANLNRMTTLMSISEITPQLFLSGQMAATPEQVQRLGITFIVNVAVESSVIVYPKHIKLERYDIIDFPTAPISSYFNTLTDKIHAHLTANKHNKVLVHCMAGISRSTTIVCAYLLRYMHMSLREAYLLCKNHRPICFPNLGFWSQLIAYEYQLKKSNSVTMVPTQFGQVPDVALEEIKQIHQQQQQQQQQPFSLPFSPPTFASTTGNNNSMQTGPPISSSNQPRVTARDIYNNHSNATLRSRSLAPNPANRPSILPVTSNVSNPASQMPLFATNKQIFLNPTRFDIRRFNAGVPIPPPEPSVPSSMSFASSRNLPVQKPSIIKPGSNYYPLQQQPVTVTGRVPNASTHPDQQRSHYETTYRASFIKPLVP